MFRKLGRHPSFDWYFALSCFAVGIAIVVALDVFFYYDLAREGGVDMSVRKPFTALSQEKVKATLDGAHKKESDARAFSKSILQDPSL
jgi:hypothetical protein